MLRYSCPNIVEDFDLSFILIILKVCNLNFNLAV